jgi:hypothetical protein
MCILKRPTSYIAHKGETVERIRTLIWVLAILAFTGPTAQAVDESRIGGNTTVPEGRQVDSAISIGGNVTVHGEVLKDAVAVAGDVIVTSTGRIGRNAIAIGGRILTEPGATVGGERIEIQRVPGLGILGEVGLLTTRIPQIQSTLTSILLFLKDIYWINTVLAAVALSLLIVFLLPSQAETVSATIIWSYWKTACAGAVGLICVPALIMMAGISVFGIPLIPVLILATAVAVLLGYAALGLLIGRCIPAGPIQQSPYLATAIGVMLLTVAGAMPVVGWLIATAAALFGFGAVVISRFGTRRIGDSANQQIHESTNE